MSSAVAAPIAHGVFWALMSAGVAFGEVTARSGGVCLLFWIAEFFGLQKVAGETAPFAAYVAVLDVALVLPIFRGDVKLS